MLSVIVMACQPETERVLGMTPWVGLAPRFKPVFVVRVGFKGKYSAPFTEYLT